MGQPELAVEPIERFAGCTDWRYCPGLGIVKTTVYKLSGHDRSPFTNAALERAKLTVLEPIRVHGTQPLEQRLGRRVRFLLQPHQYLTPNTFKRVLSSSPGPRRTRPRRMRGSDFAHAPQVRELFEETVQADTIDVSVRFGAGDRGKRGLRFTDSMQARNVSPKAGRQRNHL